MPIALSSTGDLDRQRAHAVAPGVAHQPGAGFVGGHDFVFVRTDAAGGRTRIPVHVTIGPKFSSKNRVL